MCIEVIKFLTIIGCVCFHLSGEIRKISPDLNSVKFFVKRENCLARVYVFTHVYNTGAM